MIDGGENDEKIIAIPYSDPTYNNFTNIDQLPAHIFTEMIHFFKVYKALENKETAVEEVQGVESANKIIVSAINAYKEKFGNN